MKPIIRNSVFMSLFNIFGRASGMIRYVLLVTFLSTAGYGLITYALNVGKLARHFIDGGLDNLISRDGARDHEKVSSYYLHGLIMKAILALLFFSGAFFYLKWVRHLSWNELAVVYLCLSGSAMVSMNGIIRSCFTAIERMEYVFYTNFPSRLLALILLFIVLWLSLPLIFVAFSISSEFFIWFVLLGMVSLRFFSFKNVRVRWSMFKYMILESWPLALYGFFNVFYMALDVVMIEYIMGDPESVAPYTYASQLVEGFTLLLSGYLIAIYPVLSRYHIQDREAYNRLFKQSTNLLLAYTIPLSVLLSLWSDGWMGLIPKATHVTAEVLGILALNLNLSILNTLIIIVFTSCNRQRWLVLFTGLAVLISLFSNWFLIHAYQQTGAAYASLLSQSMLLLVMGSVAKKMFHLPYPIKKPLGLLLVSMLAALVTKLIPSLHFLLIPIAYGIGWVFFAWLLGVVTWSEIQQWMKAIRKE